MLELCFTRLWLTRTHEATVNVSQELCKNYPIEEQARPAKFFSVALPTMTLVVVLLRCVARIQVASRLWWDDGAALMAMVSLRSSIVCR